MECNYSTVRIVDIEKEILKGKGIKPGIVDDVFQESYKQSESMISLAMAEASPILQTTQKSDVTASLQSFISSSGNIISNTLPLPNIVQQAVVQVSPRELDKPPISQKLPPLVQTMSVDQVWPKIRKGIRLLHPSNLEHHLLNEVTDVLKTKKSLKNTVISLPNSVYLLPLSFFKDEKLPSDCMVSIANDDKTIAVEDNKKEEVLNHPCWNTKRSRKLDVNGFSAYDRLGFYKWEAAKAKKCQKNIETIIEQLEFSILKIKTTLRVLSGTSKKLPERMIRKRRYQKSQDATLENNVVSNLADSKTLPCIDHTNFENFRQYKSCVFMSKNDVVTEMILHTFPEFSAAVEKGAVKIIWNKDCVDKCSCEGVQEQKEVKKDTMNYTRFRKFLEESKNLLDVLKDHNYCINEKSIVRQELT